MNKWSILFVVALGSALSVYALNTWVDDLSRNKAQEQRTILNETINENFEKNFQRQNFLGNVTVDQVLDQTKQIDRLLIDRTPRFNNIEGNLTILIGVLNRTVENQKTLIDNQYKFSQQLNVSGISNVTK